MRAFLALAISACLLLAASGCETPSSKRVSPEASGPPPVWPKPPAEPRIRYVRSVSTPAEWGIEKSFLRRMMDTLVGRGSEHFIRPTGVAERDGVLYVADPGARALWILDTARGRYLRVDQVRDETLAAPVALAVRADGSVFLADSRLKKVFLLDRDGKFIRVAAEKGLERPAGLAYDAARERLYVVDSSAHRVSAYGPDGALLRSWGRAGIGDGEFNHPTHLNLDRNGALLVTDALNYRVQAFDAEGRFLWKLGRHGDGSGDLAAPKGIGSDSEGHVYVVDALFDSVQIFDRDGSLLLAFGERGTQAGQFWLPGGLFIASRDRIYVADAYNQRVQIFDFGTDARKEAK